MVLLNLDPAMIDGIISNSYTGCRSVFNWMWRVCDDLVILKCFFFPLLLGRSPLPEQQGNVWCHLPGGGKTLLCTQSFAVYSFSQVWSHFCWLPVLHYERISLRFYPRLFVCFTQVQVAAAEQTSGREHLHWDQPCQIQYFPCMTPNTYIFVVVVVDDDADEQPQHLIVDIKVKTKCL